MPAASLKVGLKPANGFLTLGKIKSKEKFPSLQALTWRDVYSFHICKPFSSEPQS